MQVYLFKFYNEMILGMGLDHCRNMLVLFRWLLDTSATDKMFHTMNLHSVLQAANVPSVQVMIY